MFNYIIYTTLSSTGILSVTAEGNRLERFQIKLRSATALPAARSRYWGPFDYILLWGEGQGADYKPPIGAAAPEGYAFFYKDHELRELNVI